MQAFPTDTTVIPVANNQTSRPSAQPPRKGDFMMFYVIDKLYTDKSNDKEIL